MLTGLASVRVQASAVLEKFANDDPDLPVEPSGLRPANVMAATTLAFTPLAASSAPMSWAALHMTWKSWQPLPSTLLAQAGWLASMAVRQARISLSSPA